MSHIQARGSLLIVGSGTNGVGQTTLEAAEAMRRAEQLFYSVVEPTTELWIKGLNPSAVSFADLYGPRTDRRRTYALMIERMVAAVRRGLRVCAVFYGHPGVLVQASHRTIRLLRKEGYPARMLPGISADACLFADLGVNPGDRGLQSYEGTDFLKARRRIDPTSDLILWQVGMLGESTGGRGLPCRPERLRALTRRLRRYYPAQHRVTLYYASTFPAKPFLARRVTLEKLPAVKVWSLAMLYVPALKQRPADAAIARWGAES